MNSELPELLSGKTGNSVEASRNPSKAPGPEMGGASLETISLETCVAAFTGAIRRHLRYTLSKHSDIANLRDHHRALVHALRDHLTDAWLHTRTNNTLHDPRRVYFLSAEYMIGRHIDTVLVNLQMEEVCRLALQDFDLEIEDIVQLEWDAGLGAGGLGRLAACFLDSMSTLGIPAVAYGIRYEYGIFFQKIHLGQQIETPDYWLRYGNPWEVARPERLYPVRFYGEVSHTKASHGEKSSVTHNNAELVMAMAYDIPIPGYGNGIVNTLRQ